MNDFDNYQGVGQVSKWLFVCAGMIAVMVMIGGITRMTASGVSITEWNLVSGMIPPLHHQDWLALYTKYQNTPQFREINPDMTVEQFQTIFWWEWIHRLWGRLIGLVFVVPLLWFAWKNRLPSTLFLSLAILFVLGALQGYVGWWMVQSGIVDQPWVSPIRLTVHLGFALLLFGLIVWIGLSLWRGVSPTKFSSKAKSAFACKLLLMMIFSTILLGGMTAGSHAGLVYNQFPLMGESWLPVDYWNRSESFLANALSNPVAIQFHHRLAAEITVTLVILFGGYIFVKRRHQLYIRRVSGLFVLAGMMQFGLGVVTLLYGLPIVLASLHQLGALLLFLIGIVLTHLLSTGEPPKLRRFTDERRPQQVRHAGTKRTDRPAGG